MNSGDDRRRELATSAAALQRTVAELNDSIGSLGRRTDRSERIIALTVLGLILDVLLTFIAVWLVYGQTVVGGRIDAVCPLYGLVVGAYNPNSRSPGHDRDTYNQAYDLLRKGYAELKCTNPIVPPAVPR